MSVDVEYSDLTLMRKSILIKLKPKHEVQESRIYFKEDIDESQIQFFTVLKTSPNVTLVKEGDTVAISWLNCSSQFDGLWKGERTKMGISDEDQVEFIITDETTA